MQSPPPYSAGGRKKSSVGLIIAIVIGCLAICCVLPLAVLGKVGMDAFGKTTGMVVCASNMTALRDGLNTYAKKHNGAYPEAVNWRKDIEPYLKAPVIPPPLKPIDFKSGACDVDAGTVIAYNSDIAGKKRADMEDKEDSIVLFETPGSGSNVSKPYKEQSRESSPKVVNAPRGWVLLGPSGEAYIIGRNGRHAPLGNVSQGGGSNTTVNVNSD